MSKTLTFNHVVEYINYWRQLDFIYTFDCQETFTNTRLHELDHFIMTYSENMPSTGFFHEKDQHHNYYGLRFLLQGVEIYYYDGMKVMLDAQECLVFQADQLVQYERKTASRGINVLFPRAILAPYIQHFKKQGEKFACQTGMGKLIYDYTCSFEAEMLNLREEDQTVLANNYLMMVATWFNRNHSEYDDRFLDVLSIINQNLANPMLDLDFLSKQTQKSKRTIQNILKQHQLTFSDYLLNKRLIQATQDLLFSTLTIAEIAGKWGFYDSSHFSKCFKHKYQYPPSEYREKYVNLTACCSNIKFDQTLDTTSFYTDI